MICGFTHPALAVGTKMGTNPWIPLAQTAEWISQSWPRMQTPGCGAEESLCHPAARGRACARSPLLVAKWDLPGLPLPLLFPAADPPTNAEEKGLFCPFKSSESERE